MRALCSWWHLFRYQVQGPSNHGRVWRPLHPHWAPQSPIRTFLDQLVCCIYVDGANQFQAAVEVEAMEPTNPELAATIQAMKDRGIGILYGRWLIEGAPRVLLFDTKTAYGYLNEWKTDLWNVASIPSPDNDDETNEAVVFGYLVAWFLGEVSNSKDSGWVT